MNGAREQTITGTYNDKMQALAGLSEPWSNAACMGYCLMAMRQAGVPEPMQRRCWRAWKKNSIFTVRRTQRRLDT